MNLQKSIFLTLGMLILSLSLGFSQADAPPLSEEEITALRETAEANIKSLQLTEEQLPVFRAIAEKYGDQLMKLRDSDDGRFSKYRKMKSIKNSRNKEMKKILSEDQYERYLENQEAMEKQMNAYYKN